MTEYEKPADAGDNEPAPEDQPADAGSSDEAADNASDAGDAQAEPEGQA